jgi:hypothetical protein
MTFGVQTLLRLGAARLGGKPSTAPWLPGFNAWPPALQTLWNVVSGERAVYGQSAECTSGGKAAPQRQSA